MRGIMRKDIFSELSEVEFEGNTFKGIGQYDTYLHQLYGDYMTIPPHDEQHRHDFYLLDYNLPYRQYVDTRFFVSKLNSKV
jgi:lipopolysaccharide cholinephosphotransferase